MIDVLGRPADAPDARDNLAGAINWLAKAVAGIGARMDAIEAAVGAQRYLSVSQLAAMLGCTPSTLRRDPPRLPNFGRPDIDVGGARWSIDTVRAWQSVPIDEHRRAWEAMTGAERRAARGRAA